MRKILSLILGLLWAVPAFADLDPCRNLLNTPERLEVSKWYKSTGTIVSTDPDTRTYTNFTIQIIKSGSDAPAPSGCARNFYGPVNNFKCTFKTPENTTSCRFYNNGERVNSGTSIFPCEPNTQYTFSMDVISANPTIRNGIIYSHMQLEKGATATEFTPACTGINVATTKYTNKQFEPLDLMLSNAISVVDTVVSNTITQAGRIATLQAQKQTRPADDPSDANNAENCPAGKKCLLVEDASGVPHWYEIVERYSLLPDGYTELEYIQTDGNSWINTGYIPNGKPTIKTKLYATALGTQFWGCRWTPAPTYDTLGAIVGSGGNLTIYYGLYGNEEFTAFSDYRTGVVHTFELGESSIIYDGLTTNISRENISSTYSFVVGGFNNNGEINQTGISRIYSMEVKESGNMMLNLIPAKRDSDGAIGMFDTVSGTFFTNAGTGTFTAGPVAE